MALQELDVLWDKIVQKQSEKGREAVLLPRGKRLAKHLYLLLEQPFSDCF